MGGDDDDADVGGAVGREEEEEGDGEHAGWGKRIGYILKNGIGFHYENAFSFWNTTYDTRKMEVDLCV